MADEHDDAGGVRHDTPVQRSGVQTPFTHGPAHFTIRLAYAQLPVEHTPSGSNARTDDSSAHSFFGAVTHATPKHGSPLQPPSAVQPPSHGTRVTEYWQRPPSPQTPTGLKTSTSPDVHIDAFGRRQLTPSHAFIPASVTGISTTPASKPASIEK